MNVDSYIVILHSTASNICIGFVGVSFHFQSYLSYHFSIILVKKYIDVNEH